MKIKRVAGLFALIVFCLFVGSLGSLATETSRTTWYAALHKPMFNPPDWVFAPVWITLYILMAVAGWRLCACGGKARAGLMLLFALQLALNGLWSFLFFGLRNPLLAFVDILALEICLIALIAGARKIDLISAYLLAPYLLWVSFATYLNCVIWWLNQ